MTFGSANRDSTQTLNPAHLTPAGRGPIFTRTSQSVYILAFPRYCFTRLLCTNQSSVYCPLPSALPALLQYYCTSSTQHTTPPRPPFVYAIHHTILVMAISCEGQFIYYEQTSWYAPSPPLLGSLVSWVGWWFFVWSFVVLFLSCVWVCDLFLFDEHTLRERIRGGS